jgi:hypothetical protein
MSELATDYTPLSGYTLVDNLNHIRNRITTLETSIPTSGGGSGSSIDVMYSGILVASGISELDFGGNCIVNETESGAKVTITNGKLLTYISEPWEANAADTFIINPKEDSPLLYMLNADSNQNSWPELSIGVHSTYGTYRTLYKDVYSGFPIDAVIKNITMYFTQVGASVISGIAYIYRMKTSWIEAEATWNSASTGVSWSEPGAFGVTDCEQEPIGSISFYYNTESDHIYSAELNAEKVIEMINGTFTNNGFLIKTDELVSDCYLYVHASNEDSGGA